MSNILLVIGVLVVLAEKKHQKQSKCRKPLHLFYYFPGGQKFKNTRNTKSKITGNLFKVE